MDEKGKKDLDDKVEAEDSKDKGGAEKKQDKEQKPAKVEAKASEAKEVKKVKEEPQKETGDDGVQALLRRIEDTLSTEEELRRKNRWLSWAIPLGVILVFAIFIGLMYSSVKNIKQDRFIEALEGNSMRIWPQLTAELKRVGEKTYPVYAKAVENELSKPMPGLETKIEREISKLQANFDKSVTGKLNAAFAAVDKKQRQALLEEFPTLKNDPAKLDAMLKATQKASKDWAKERLNKVLEDSVRELKNLQQVLDKGFKLKKGEKATFESEYILTLWLEILNEKVVGKSTIIPEKKGK